MKQLNYKKDNLKIKVVEVTLLSVEELEACTDYVKAPAEDPMEPRYWYLRTPAEDGEICLACESDVDEPTDPGYDDNWDIEDDDGFILYTVHGTGVRPVLRLDSETLSDTITLEPGDEVEINEINFTYISNNLLLADRFLRDACGDYGIFDETTNIYEDSEAKERVDEWFEEKIKPFL